MNILNLSLNRIPEEELAKSEQQKDLVASHDKTKVTPKINFKIALILFSTAVNGTLVERKKALNTFSGEFIHLGPSYKNRMPLALDKVESLLGSRVLQKVSSTVTRTNEKFK